MNGFEKAMGKKRALAEAESSGLIADSHEVRLGLMRKVKAGELTLAQAQAELRRIQDSAASVGKKTRAGAWRDAK